MTDLRNTIDSTEFIRRLVQRSVGRLPINASWSQRTTTMVQILGANLQASVQGDIKVHPPRGLAGHPSGLAHRLFEERSAKAFIGASLDARHEHAFERCLPIRPSGRLFRLCYLLVKGVYVDADDVCVGTNCVIDWLFDDGRLKIQPLCYDVASGTMVHHPCFFVVMRTRPLEVFYFNNNPLIADRGHRIIEHALRPT